MPTPKTKKTVKAKEKPPRKTENYHNWTIHTLHHLGLESCTASCAAFDAKHIIMHYICTFLCKNK
jgi:hypothetical protein